MGKQVTFLTFLIFADLFFIATGQITSSVGSILFEAITGVVSGNISGTDFFTFIIGNAADLASSAGGLFALFAGSAVFIGSFIATKEFRVLLIPVMGSLALIASDFILLAEYLFSLNLVLGIFIMAPLTIIYVFTVAEWLIGKD